jgi:teichuronic acid exporter
MSNITHALRGASWLGLFKLFSQIASWTGTIIVTRILTSEDYGIVEMSSIFTSYILFFVEFGVGTAIVNQKEISKEELSSAFWCMAIWGFLLSLSCVFLGPITANYFKEPRIEPLTMAIGLLFIFGSLSIVPRSILQRDLKFKEIGMIEMLVTLASVIFSITLAYCGAGAWTLIGSYILREFISMTSYYLISKYKPIMHFTLSETIPFLRFGLPVVLSSSLYYVYSKADKFFGGAELGAELLGFYAVALQLAAIPVEKIVTLVQGVLYPTLSKVKDEPEEFRRIYLCFISLIALITFPIYISGYLLADNVITLVIGEKWAPCIPSFKLLLIGQLVMAITAPNNLVHLARGKPKWNTIFHLILTPAMVISFWFSANLHDLDSLALPWVFVYPFVTALNVFMTNKEMHISAFRYLTIFKHPVSATLLIGIFIQIISNLLAGNQLSHSLLSIIGITIGSIIIYAIYFLTIGSTYTKFMKSILKGSNEEPYF